LLRYLGRGERPGVTIADENVRAVLDSCSDAVLGLDRQGCCVLANSAAEALFGRRRTELEGLGAHTLLPGLARVIDEATDRRRAGRRRGGPVGPGIEATAVRLDGARVPVAVWLSPAVEGEALTTYLTVRDLTVVRATAAAHAALREEVVTLRESLDAVCRAVRDRAIWVLDPDGHIIQVNRAAEKLLGYRTEEIAGRHCAVLSDPADLRAVAAELKTPEGVDPLLEITRSGLPNQQEWNLRTKDGHHRAVTLHVVAIGPRQAPVGFVWVAAERAGQWEPLVSRRSVADRLLFDLDDAETRTLRWQVGGSGTGKRR
jgi:PAS domain S-box-containing protein